MDYTTSLEIYIEYYDGNKKYLMNNEIEDNRFEELTLKRFNVSKMSDIFGFREELKLNEPEASKVLEEVYKNEALVLVTRKANLKLKLQIVDDSDEYEHYEEITLDFEKKEFKIRFYNYDPDQIWERHHDECL